MIKIIISSDEAGTHPIIFLIKDEHYKHPEEYNWTLLGGNTFITSLRSAIDEVRMTERNLKRGKEKLSNS